MTDLQDLVLDRLVGTPVGINWRDGPLAVAAEAVGGEKHLHFGLSDKYDRAAKNEIARRLGYPIILCEAMQGANRGLESEEHRRSFAMTLFSTIRVGEALPKLFPAAQNRIALHLAIRAHPYVCDRSDCAVPRVFTALLESATITTTMATEAARTRCETAGGTLKETAIGWMSPGRDTPVQRLLQTAVMALRGFEKGKSVHAWCSVRESARLAASQRGLTEALACCTEVAQMCWQGER